MFEIFSESDKSVVLIEKIRNGEISLLNAKNDQLNFQSRLGKIKKGRSKSKEQKNKIKNINILYKGRKDAIKFYDDYSSMVSEAKTKVKGTWLKISTLKQMLQR